MRSAVIRGLVAGLLLTATLPPAGWWVLGPVGGPLAPAARVGGQLLLVGLVGLAGAGLAELYATARRRGRPGAAAAGATAIVLVAGMALLGTVAPEGRARGRLRVALVQGGGRRGLLAVERAG